MFRTASKPQAVSSVYLHGVFRLAPDLINSSTADAEPAQPSANIVASGNPVGIASRLTASALGTDSNLGQVANYAGDADYFGSLPLGRHLANRGYRQLGRGRSFLAGFVRRQRLHFRQRPVLGSIAGRHLDEPMTDSRYRGRASATT